MSSRRAEEVAPGWRDGGWRWRAWALCVSLGVIAATAWPLSLDPSDSDSDSFPLSTYPMFSSVRKTAWMHVVVGYDAAGVEHKIPPPFVANTEVMQASETIRIAIRKRRAKQLCAHVGERLADLDDDHALAEVVRVEVQSRRFNPKTYFVEPDGAAPLKLRRRATCMVPGRADLGEMEAS